MRAATATDAYYVIGFVNLCVSIKGVAQLCNEITSAPTIGVTLERANDGNGSRRRAAYDSTSASLPMRPDEPPRRTARGAVGAWDTTAPTQRSHLCQRRPARTLEFGGYPHRPPATHSIRILNSSLSPISNGSNSGPAAPRWRWDLLLFKKPYYCTHCWSLENKDTYPKGGTCEPKRGKILRVKRRRIFVHEYLEGTYFLRLGLNILYLILSPKARIP